MKTPLRTGWLLHVYTAIVFAFIFAPLVTIAVFSFNADRFPSLPWAGFSLTWYQAVFADPTIARGHPWSSHRTSHRFPAGIGRW